MFLLAPRPIAITLFLSKEALVLESCRSTEVDCWQKRGTRSCGRGPRLAHSGERGGEDSDSARAVRQSPASDR